MGNEPGTCPRVVGGDPGFNALGCVYITGQLLRLDGSSIPFSSVRASYVLPGALIDTVRGMSGGYTDGQGRFTLSDVVHDYRPFGSPPALDTLVTVRIYASSGWSTINPVDSLDTVAQFTVAGEKPPPLHIVWKTAKVR